MISVEEHILLQSIATHNFKMLGNAPLPHQKFARPNVGIINGRKVGTTNVERPLAACNMFQISSKSVNWIKSYRGKRWGPTYDMLFSTIRL
jgi:hypothetical protein